MLNFFVPDFDENDMVPSQQDFGPQIYPIDSQAISNQSS